MRLRLGHVFVWNRLFPKKCPKCNQHKIMRFEEQENSRINLLDTPDEIAKKIKKAKTDAVRGASLRCGLDHFLSRRSPL